MAQKPSRNQDSPRPDPRAGSIFIWIFVMIALFGALTFAMIQSMRGGSAAIGKDKAKLMATEIIASATQMRDGVKGLKINGCQDNQISLYNTVTTIANYGNGGATDNCLLFSPSGGGLKVPVPPPNSQVKDKITSSNFLVTPHFAYTAVNKFFVDDGASELTMWLFHLQPEVCNAINNLLGIGPNITTGDFDFNESQFYNGNYPTFGFAPLNSPGASDLTGKSMACANYTGGYSTEVGRVFYAILLKRP